jgi:hypothetical protein
MKRLSSGFILLAAVVFMFSGFSLAERTQTGKDADQLGGLYNPNTVEKARGEIGSIDYGAESPDVTLKLLPAGGKLPITVHLGPGWYLARLQRPLEPGQLIEITGSRVMIAGAPAIIAAFIHVEDMVTNFRDVKTGKPYWWR